MSPSNLTRNSALDAAVIDAIPRLLCHCSNRLAQYPLLSKTDVKDISQDVVLRFYESIANGKSIPLESVQPWLRATCTNIIRERSRYSTRMISDHDCNLDDLAGHLQNLENECIAEKLPFIRELDPDERTLLELRYDDGLKWKEIAQRLNRSEEAVRQHHSRIIKKLRQKLVSSNYSVVHTV